MLYELLCKICHLFFFQQLLFIKILFHRLFYHLDNAQKATKYNKTNITYYIKHNNNEKYTRFIIL